MGAVPIFPNELKDGLKEQELVYDASCHEPSNCNKKS